MNDLKAVGGGAGSNRKNTYASVTEFELMLDDSCQFLASFAKHAACSILCCISSNQFKSLWKSQCLQVNIHSAASLGIMCKPTMV